MAARPLPLVDKWHHDTLPLDYVVTVTDPTVTTGGRFEYFLGTKADAAELRAAGRTPDRDRVVAPPMPGPGWAVALHGNMVVHRGGPLTAPAERITMVNGYVAMEPEADNQSRTIDLLAVDDHELLFTEWARFVAWRVSSRLQHVIDTIEFGVDPAEASRRLRDAVADAVVVAEEMQAIAVEIDHYEEDLATTCRRTLCRYPRRIDRAITQPRHAESGLGHPRKGLPELAAWRGWRPSAAATRRTARRRIVRVAVGSVRSP